MLIDDSGKYGGGSDHNWLFINLDDSFVKKDLSLLLPKRNHDGILMRTMTGLISVILLTI